MVPKIVMDALLDCIAERMTNETAYILSLSPKYGPWAFEINLCAMDDFIQEEINRDFIDTLQEVRS